MVNKCLASKVFPTSLGLENAVALAEVSQKGLETVTKAATTAWLQEEVAQVQELQGMEVAVASKSVALSLSEEAAELVPSSTADGTALRVAIGSVALLFPALLFVVSWRCGKRLAPRVAIPQAHELKLAIDICPDACDIRRASIMDDDDFRLAEPIPELPELPPETNNEKTPKGKRLVPRGRAKRKVLAVAKARRLVPKGKVKETPEAELSNDTELNEIRIGFDVDLPTLPTTPSRFSWFDDDSMLEPPEPWQDEAEAAAPEAAPAPLEQPEGAEEPKKPKKLKKRLAPKKKKQVRVSEDGIFEGWEDEAEFPPPLPWEDFTESDVNVHAQAGSSKDDPHETW